MGTDHPSRDKQAHRAKPSLWAAEPIGDSLSLLENALREDEPSLWDGEDTDDVNSPPEETARPSRASGSAIGPHPKKRRSRTITQLQYHGRTVPSVGGHMRHTPAAPRI